MAVVIIPSSQRYYEYFVEVNDMPFFIGLCHIGANINSSNNNINKTIIIRIIIIRHNIVLSIITPPLTITPLTITTIML